MKNNRLISIFSYYTSCNPEWLDANYRYNKLIRKLDIQISESSVICLQELSLEWTGRLHSYFVNRNYYLVTSQYGNKFNGYMGVGIAFPLERYSLQDVNITRIADTKRLTREEKVQETFLQKIKRKFSGLWLTTISISTS